MEPYNLFCHLMADELTLRAYERGDEVDMPTLFHHLHLLAHQERYEVGDHYYERWRKELTGKKEPEAFTLAEVLTEWAPRMAESYLLVDGQGLPRVREGRWNDWQLTLRAFSPLVLVAMALWRAGREAKGTPWPTALPTARVEGTLHDLHLHLGACAEADAVWCDMIDQPNGFVRQRRQSSGFALFFHQTLITSYQRLYALLVEARRLLCGMAADGKSGQPRQWTLETEAQTLIETLGRLKASGDEALARRLHHYLLIKGAMRRLLVVESHQKGLGQFGHTLHQPFRGPQRFADGRELLRMACPAHGGPTRLELRLAPSHLKRIPELREGVRRLRHQGYDVEVRFVCHFIKGTRDGDIRKSTREILAHRTLLCGVDTAGARLTVEPGTFAEAYQTLREAGVRHFTFHAGEDFFHLLGGMRHIYEAVERLALQPGDRIGHASAAGVDPRLWAYNLEGRVPVSVGEYRRDLLFVAELNVADDIRQRATRAAGQLRGKPTDLLTVGCFDALSPDDLVRVQQALLFHMAGKGIAIEATPTSNITIGHAHNFQSYHLATWLRWKHIDHRTLPPIVLGSDEQGVLPTNIANEYANVEEMLAREPLFGRERAKDIVGQMKAAAEPLAF